MDTVHILRGPLAAISNNGHQKITGKWDRRSGPHCGSRCHGCQGHLCENHLEGDGARTDLDPESAAAPAATLHAPKPFLLVLQRQSSRMAAACTCQALKDCRHCRTEPNT